MVLARQELALRQARILRPTFGRRSFVPSFGMAIHATSCASRSLSFVLSLQSSIVCVLCPQCAHDGRPRDPPTLTATAGSCPSWGTCPNRANWCHSSAFECAATNTSPMPTLPKAAILGNVGARSPGRGHRTAWVHGVCGGGQHPCTDSAAVIVELARTPRIGVPIARVGSSSVNQQ
jgi:hypothetical protein